MYAWDVASSVFNGFEDVPVIINLRHVSGRSGMGLLTRRRPCGCFRLCNFFVVADSESDS